jgi:hypothetical protein
MIIFARKPIGKQTWTDSNSFYVISNISMNFNNRSGILSSASQQQLYNMSLRNGVNTNYYEYSGVACTGVQGIVGRTKLETTTSLVPTTGSVLCINPSLDLGLGAAFSNMSGGQFNVQFDIMVANQTNLGPQDIEICLLCVNSGLFITRNGTSEIQTGLLSQEMVLDAREKPSAMDTGTYTRLVGGATENLQTIHKHLKHLFKKNVVNNQLPALENAGASCGGTMSAGASSRKRLNKFYK